MGGGVGGGGGWVKSGGWVEGVGEWVEGVGGWRGWSGLGSLDGGGSLDKIAVTAAKI